MPVTVKVYSVNKLPGDAINRIVNRWLGHAELLSKVCRLLTLRIPLANLANSLCVELGQLLRCSVLGRHVLRVIGSCAEKQMVGADTGRIVAAMTDKQAGGDRSVHQFPTEAMGQFGLVVDGEDAVTGGQAASTPLPASVSSHYVLPEAIFGGFNKAASVALGIAEPLGSAGPKTNFFSTVITSARFTWAATRSILGNGGGVTGVGTVQAPTRSDFARVDEELDATRLACTSDERVATLGGHVLSLLHRLGAVVPGVLAHRPASSILPKPTYPRHFSVIGGVGCV